MSADPGTSVGALEEGALDKAQEFVEAEGGVTNRLSGRLGAFVAAVAVAMSLFHLYSAHEIVQTWTMRPVHVAFVLFLTFLLFPVARRFRHRVMWWDWAMAALSLVVIAYMIQGGDDFT